MYVCMLRGTFQCTVWQSLALHTFNLLHWHTNFDDAQEILETFMLNLHVVVEEENVSENCSFRPIGGNRSMIQKTFLRWTELKMKQKDKQCSKVNCHWATSAAKISLVDQQIDPSVQLQYFSVLDNVQRTERVFMFYVCHVTLWN